MIAFHSHPARGLGRQALLLLAGLLLATAGGGCAAVPLATVGTLAGVTATAVSTGTDVYQLGKLDTAELAGFHAAVGAARRAAAELCLVPRGSECRKRGGVLLSFADTQGAGLKVLVEPRTASLVRVRVDVGWFGSEPTARLFLSRMRAHLPPPAATGPSRAPEVNPRASASSPSWAQQT